MKKIYRGISDEELKSYKNEIPVGKKFTTDVFMAMKFGKNVVSVNFNKNSFKEVGESDVFKKLKIKERYYKNKKPIRKFTKVGILR